MIIILLALALVIGPLPPHVYLLPPQVPHPTNGVVIIDWDVSTNVNFYQYEVWKIDHVPCSWSDSGWQLVSQQTTNRFIATNNTDKQFFTVNVLYK